MHSPSISPAHSTQWYPIVLVLALVATSGVLFVHGAPVVSDSVASQSLEAISPAQSEIPVETIFQSKMENQCDNNQDRKDFCERCVRFVFERSAGYLGCCTNYDGIYNFCEKFLNYSFDEASAMSPMSKASPKMSKGLPYYRK